MKVNPSTAIRRALAMLLALIMAAALPAIGEEIGITLDDGADAPATEQGDLAIEELPELSDALELSDDIDLSLEDVEPSLAEGELNGDAENTMKPYPDTRPMVYTLNVERSQKFTMGTKDDLIIITPEGDIASWTNSNDSVVRIERDAKKKNRIKVYPLALGATKITVVLGIGKSYKVNLEIKDLFTLKKVYFSKKSVTLYTGMDLDLNQYIVREPYTAVEEIIFSTSDTSVAPMDRNCIITAAKEGKAVITLRTNKGMRDTMNVVVKANTTGDLYPEPSDKELKALGNTWTLRPKSLEMKGNGTITCKLWMLNGSAGKTSAIKNLAFSVYAKDGTGNTLIARCSIKQGKLVCDKNDWHVLSFDFPTKYLYSTAQNFTAMKAKDLLFQLDSMPAIVIDGSNGGFCRYKPDKMPISGEKAKDNSPRYRALLVSESDFYNPSVKDASERWEHATRNKNDVALMKKMLQGVKTPDGSTYTITTWNNTSVSQLKQLIRNTFADAKENDVSLFFIASHGDSDEDTPADKAGAITMASQGEKKAESITLSELRDALLKVPGKVIVILESCGSGAAVYASNGSGSRLDSLAKSAEAFNARAVEVFRSADPGVVDSDYAANTGEFRRENKFYVLTASAYREESYGYSNGYNVFTEHLAKGVGKSGNMPADKAYVGNGNGTVDLHELYRYISGESDYSRIKIGAFYYYQHVQVYPSDLRFALFK